MQQKIIGKLVKTVERKFYKEELDFYLQESSLAFHAELPRMRFIHELYWLLYPGNEVQRRNIANRDFICCDVRSLFYQSR